MKTLFLLLLETVYFTQPCESFENIPQLCHLGELSFFQFQ